MKVYGFVHCKTGRVSDMLRCAERDVWQCERLIEKYQREIRNARRRIEHKKLLAAKYRDILAGLEVRSACEKPLKRWKDEPKPQTPEPLF